MRVVVKLKLGVALETDRYGVIDGVSTTTPAWIDMMQLDLHPAEAMADAAAAVAGNQELICF